MAEDLIRYDVLAQEALRGLVRKVLSEVAQAGLPGEHHFFITFDTRHPGVRISSRLKEQYPADMTVVLQHQFWDLAVNESAFEVGLSFKGVPERLVVPFRAVQSFVALHANFALKFEPALTPVAGNNDEPASVEKEPAATPGETPRPVPEAGADVVSLDAFRKKS
jgi:uncharacterized protein